MDMQYGHMTWLYNMGIQYGHIPCNMDIQYGHMIWAYNMGI